MAGAFFEEGTKVVPAAGSAPERDKNHRLTRAGMQQVIDEGGSVKFVNEDGDARLATRHEHLPTAADLAGNDAAERARVRESLLLQHRELSAELAKLGPASGDDDEIAEMNMAIPTKPKAAEPDPEVVALRRQIDEERKARETAEATAESERKSRQDAEAKLAAKPAPAPAPAPAASVSGTSAPAPGAKANPADKPAK